MQDPSPRIRPISTRYAGRLFRSRLEARWAVVLDSLGISWEYEPEGYAVDGVAYLPDFWLPKWNVFLEVKPERELMRDEWRKAVLLSDASGFPVLIAKGLSRESEWNRVRGHRPSETYFVAECPTCGAILLGPTNDTVCQDCNDHAIVSARVAAAIDRGTSCRFDTHERAARIPSVYETSVALIKSTTPFLGPQSLQRELDRMGIDTTCHQARQAILDHCIVARSEP